MMIVKRKRKDKKMSDPVIDVTRTDVNLIQSPLHLPTHMSENNTNNNGIGGGKRKNYKRLYSEEAKTNNKSGLLKKTKQKGSLDSLSDRFSRADSESYRNSEDATSSKDYGAIETVNTDDVRLPAEYPTSDHLTERRTSAHRVSYRKAIQKAGYNMNELVSATTASFSPVAQRRMIPNTEVDWTESALSDDHLWAPSNASGDLCYVGEQNCVKSGGRKKCSACHIVVHDACYAQLVRIGFRCKTTFREATTRSMRETLVVHHHWVHRRKQEGKCKHCSKSFEKRFGFREPTKIVAISCSWCKETYHNKVSCFQMHKINEPCSLGNFAKSIVPPTWITKSSQKQKSLRNRSKKKRGSGGTWRKKSSKESRQKTFVIRPLSHQAAFLAPTLIFINPKSGGNQGAKLLQAFQWIVNPRQIFDLSKGGPQEGLELFRKVPNLRILACGGDGTVGWILSVLDKLAMPRPPPVAILPLGTGNDLSRTLNFGPGYTDETVPKILQGVEEARPVKLDRWKIYVEKNEQAHLASKHTDDDEMSFPSSEDNPPLTGVDQPPLDVVNNYFSIGSDANVSLAFHESREAHPDKFKSRTVNKMYYVRVGVFEYLTRQSKDLSKHITVVCDGQNITPKIRELKPVCIVFLNIPKYSSGTCPWGSPTGTEFVAQRHDDKLIEVLAFSPNQLGMIFVGGHGERLCQCRSAYIRTYKTFPMQIDGEPCRLNPSNIKFEFLNQANVLYKSKRRISAASDPHPHDQIKIRLNLLTNHDFDAQGGKKDKLVTKASPFLVTVVMSNSRLDVLRSCLDSLNNAATSNEPTGERWFFLDSSDDDRFYRIDQNQENLHLVCDVITADRELYILEISEPQTSPLLHFPVRSRTIDRKSVQFRGRVHSDSVVIGDNLAEPVDFTILAQQRLSMTSNKSETEVDSAEIKSGNSSPRVFTSQKCPSPLDVVFEQTREEESTLKPPDDVISLQSDGTDVTPAMDPEMTPDTSEETTEMTQQLRDSMISIDSEKSKDSEPRDKAVTTSPGSSLTASPITSQRVYESDGSAYSTSSNEYVITDETGETSQGKIAKSRQQSLMTQRSPKKAPLRPAQSNPPIPTGQLLGDFVSKLDESGEKDTKKKHRRSNTDTDPKKSLASGGQMLLSNFVKTMKLSSNNNNNNNSNNNLNIETCQSCTDVTIGIPHRHSNRRTTCRRHSYTGARDHLSQKTENRFWDSRLLEASERGDVEAMRKAVHCGADLFATTSGGETALHCATRGQHNDAIKYLTKEIPEIVNLTDTSKRSALHLAVENCDKDVCVDLVRAGATIGMVDAMGLSVIDRAKSTDDTSLVDFLTSEQKTRLKAVMQIAPETDL
uniref:Diacylglycerol kinase n=1 Tax=Phallusia mammillata TaxID=59560 RepID=A0A6F9DBE8_9ASCI|nr:diacylglycerol kinase zeta-like [Phallusia mammillata]